MSDAWTNTSDSRPVSVADSADLLDSAWSNWRVLLPSPGHGISHLILLGGPRGLETVITRSGIAERVSRELPLWGRADAAVVLGDAAAVVPAREVAANLRPGAWLYWEITRRGVVPSIQLATSS